jgi:hypothetical protein
MKTPQIFSKPAPESGNASGSVGGDPSREADTVPRNAPLGGTREQAIQRLQVGLSGIAVMLVMIGLATVVTQRAQLTEASAVPEAAATTEPEEASAQNDPLADAGIVPDLPDEAEEEAALEAEAEAEAQADAAATEAEAEAGAGAGAGAGGGASTDNSSGDEGGQL